MISEAAFMSKYDPLWQRIQENGTADLKLSFSETERIAGFPTDHSFLTYKKELTAYGYKVGRVSLKEKTVNFEKI